MEKWTRWEPINGLSGSYYHDSFLWSEKGFIIELINEGQGKRVQILFDNYVDAFRYTNESFYLKIFDNSSQENDTDFYANWSFFKIANSEYLAWLSEKSCTWSDRFNFIHFCIVGGDEVIDIVTNYEPKVTIIDYKREVKIYTRQEFGLELKAKVKNRENLARIEMWAFNVYRDNLHTIDGDFKKVLYYLSAMERSYEKLDQIADRLIADQDVKL